MVGNKKIVSHILLKSGALGAIETHHNFHNSGRAKKKSLRVQ